MGLSNNADGFVIDGCNPLEMATHWRVACKRYVFVMLAVLGDDGRFWAVPNCPTLLKSIYANALFSGQCCRPLL